MTTPSTTPTPVTLSRIAAACNRCTIAHTITEQLPGSDTVFPRPTIATGFPNVMLLIDLDPQAGIRIQGSWRGILPATEIPALLAAVSEHNLHSIGPALATKLDDQQQAIVTMRRVWPVNHGATDAQLDAVIASTVAMVTQAATMLDHTFPAAVTWSEHDHD
ncbi:hypothetical protein ACFPVT_06190 [Corynebacterium choanae]|uniref:YbjN domain-containing protein n=1 Tax=Corynebacterium choanae TaxID=1862358 RepID=A0A3G6J7B5_9CORY|nr:hypothetical protein [Corynebacterium choanae]AZA13663.1 hypothetical protein CCHOA_06320 [Corynebacterium choanae]